MTLAELNSSIQNEYNQLVKNAIKNANERNFEPYLYFIQHAYEWAHYNEIADFFENMEEEDYENDWRELVDNCKNTDEVLSGVFDAWLSYSHPDRFNFFCWEDLTSIIKDWLHYASK